MKVTRLSNSGVMLLEHDVFEDNRGVIMEAYHSGKLRDYGITARFKQDVVTVSNHNVLRGLHYQVPAQGKLITVLEGIIFDVAVCLATKQVTGIHLRAEGHQSLWVPPGHAHGYYVISESATVLYRMTELYRPMAQHVIRWDDEELKIVWPEECKAPILSGQDNAGLK